MHGADVAFLDGGVGDFLDLEGSGGGDGVAVGGGEVIDAGELDFLGDCFAGFERGVVGAGELGEVVGEVDSFELQMLI